MTKVECSTEGGEWIATHRQPDSRLWTARLSVPIGPLATITVRAVDESGRSDGDSIGAWPENDIWGRQLGPNRNGKPF